MGVRIGETQLLKILALVSEALDRGVDERPAIRTAFLAMAFRPATDTEIEFVSSLRHDLLSRLSRWCVAQDTVDKAYDLAQNVAS